MDPRQAHFRSYWLKTARYVLFLFILVSLIIATSTGSVAGYETDTRPIDDLDGSAVYTGEELRVNLTDSTLNLTAGETVYLVRYTDRPSFTVEETATVDERGIVSGISTDELSTGDQYAFSSSASSSTAVTDGEFSLLDSDFSAAWDTEAATGETTDGVIEISSARAGDFDLTISADGLEYEQLEPLFNDSATVVESRESIPFEELGYEPEDTTAEEVIDDGYITVTDWNSNSDELNANFSALSASEGLPSAGEYSFEFVVTDTGKRDTNSIEIAERNEDASLDKSLYETAAGDLVTAEIELKDTEEAFVQIRDRTGFADVVYINIDDPDKPVELQLNTRLLGTDHRSIDGLGGAYEAENVDRLVSAYHDGQSNHLDIKGSSPFAGTDGIGSPPEIDGTPIFVDGQESLTYQEYLKQSGYLESGKKSDMLQRPLQPTNYQIEIAGIANVGEQGVFDADVGEPNDRIARSTMVFTEPTISNISVYQLSEGDASATHNIAGLTGTRSPANNISNGDRIAVRVEMTGIFGAIAAGGPDRAADTDRIDESFDTELLAELSASNNGFDFVIESVQEVGNQKPSSVNFGSDSDATYALSDYANRSLFVVINTKSANALTKDQPSEETNFNIKAKYDSNITDERYRFENNTPLEGAFSSEQRKANHPYLPVDEERRITRTFSLGPPKLSYNNMFKDEVHILNAPKTYLEGDTNIRAGTEAHIELISRNDPSNVVVTDLNINSGSFATEPFNTSKFSEGSAVAVRPRIENKNVPATTGRVVEQFGEYDEISNLTASNSDSRTVESIPGEAAEDVDSGVDTVDETADNNHKIIHLVVVALLSFVVGTTVGVKIK